MCHDRIDSPLKIKKVGRNSPIFVGIATVFSPFHTTIESHTNNHDRENGRLHPLTPPANALVKRLPYSRTQVGDHWEISAVVRFAFLFCLLAFQLGPSNICLEPSYFISNFCRTYYVFGAGYTYIHKKWR